MKIKNGSSSFRAKLVSRLFISNTLVFSLSLLLCLFLVGAYMPVNASQENSARSTSPQHIYLVRHAEKMLGNNPGLTKKGQLRAKYLSKLLKEKNIDVIYSTRFKRTIETARPLAQKLDKGIVFYSPTQLEKFSKSLLSEGKNYLVVGHSNTTPKLVEFLGGDSGGLMSESEYTKLFQLIIKGDDIQTRVIIIDDRVLENFKYEESMDASLPSIETLKGPQ